MNPPKILIIGAGAIGGFYGALLAKSGADVAVVCRSDYETVKQQGFSIHSHNLGNWIFRPSQVLKHAGEYSGSADYVILCTKAVEHIDGPALIKLAVDKNTAIVFIQNGVETEQKMQDAFPQHEIISGLAFICCNRLEPGEILHLAYGKLVLGNFPDGISPKTDLLGKLINQAGMTCLTTPDIVTARWQKCIWNAPFNPLSVLSGGLATQEILGTQEKLVRAIMQEIVDIARACGHELAADSIDTNIKNTYAMPPYKTSMLLDFERGQPMEIEAIIGNAVRAGRRKNVAIPHLETVYGLLKLRELQFNLSHKASPGQQ
ncbi:MAG: 2-dehydropantoate 2-reductase [Methylicorpusculum sp.]|uniref:ketopantoate reductase family protein n=1 Tax=Methylicorpusculum sp. TaxID=2713644 RepID=UPI00272625FD|nr:2-dehydropantoate 2-reductase [Methylicorpusculum sp.]MDO8940544.1 2-dehydropantoate 2-reductase [Methylicorpusculum sp.]MDP2204450.1 2-dehydropantoate 2-reductase [Methylicorpusculum sp.]